MILRSGSAPLSFCRLSKRHRRSSAGTACSNSARLCSFETNRRRPELLDGGDYRAGLKFLSEERLIGVKLSAVESPRKSSSFCGEFWIHMQFCLLSSRLQMPQSTWGWLSGTWFQYNLSSHIQALHVLYVWMCDLSRMAADSMWSKNILLALYSVVLLGHYKPDCTEDKKEKWS